MFQLTQEQSMLREAVDRYWRDRVDAGERGWSEDGWRRLADELGILAAPFPEELGGLGGGLADAVVILELLGEHLIRQPYLQSVVMGGHAIAVGGGPCVKERLAAIAAGEMTVAIAYQEAFSRGCLSNIGLRAARAEQGAFVLTGRKIMVTAAPWSSHLLVSVRTAGGQCDAAGVSLFLVERARPGLSYKCAHTIDGWACSDIDFDDVTVTEADRIGGEGDALPILCAMIDSAIVGLCAEGVGLMRSMISQTSHYIQQRRQFGKPLADFQVLQHRLVDMRLALEQAISIVRAATVAVGKRVNDCALLVASAKFVVNRALNLIGRSAIQMHGAIGMMDETPLSHYFRRSTALQLQFGSADDHLAAFACEAGATVPDCGLASNFIASISGGEAAETAVFRAEVRAFLDAELTPELRDHASWETGAFATPPTAEPWQKKLVERGWGAPLWPPEYGGPGWTPRQRQIFQEELVFAGAPRQPAMGMQMVAPVLMRYGTPDQKAWFLPRILSGEDYWCQGYSEPNAGSDLAAIQLQAARDGDEYVLNGSKIWTTFAQYANWIFLLVRTAKRDRQQDGISFLLVPMSTPGITIRPLISLSGDHEVNQVFFDDVRVSVSNRVGAEHDGWQVAKYLLEFERGVGHQVPALLVQLSHLRHIARREHGQDGQSLWLCPTFRRRFAKLEIRTLAIRLTEERLVYALPAGQNVGDFAASLMKLCWSEIGQEIAELTIEALGPYAAIDQQAAFEKHDPSLVTGPQHSRTGMRRYLNDRVLTIAGGTSEVQRTIVCKYILNQP